MRRLAQRCRRCGGQRAAATLLLLPAASGGAFAQYSGSPYAIEAAPPLASGLLPRDLSPWGMFVEADVVVQGVMVGLAFASFVTWTIWIAKSLQLFRGRRYARNVLGEVRAAGSLAEVLERAAPLRGAGVALIREADEEVAKSADTAAAGIKERVASRLERLEADAARHMQRGIGMLATIASTAPFVGLFGTVWGIMNAFVGIAASQTTNLAIVAPGIAEALLATALGLVAAVPAVVFYNLFARGLAVYRARLRDTGAGIERLVSRDLDRRRPHHLLAAE